MPQQIVITANGELRVIETGPPGPPGAPGGGSNSASTVNLADIRYVDSIVDLTQLDDEVTEEEFVLILAGPLPFGLGLRMAVVNASPDIDGIYYGMTPIEDLGDPELWLPPVRVEDLTARALLGGIWVKSFITAPLSGVWFTKRDGQDVDTWSPVTRIDSNVGAPSDIVIPSGAFLLDLRLDSGSVDHPVWGNVPPEDYVSVAPMPDDDEVGEPTSFTYLEVDFSVLPDNRDTLVVLLANQRWNIVPTAWPAHTRGPWAVCFQFESAHSSNQLMMGTTQAELDTWGFMPTTVPNLTIGYHSGRGDS